MSRRQGALVTLAALALALGALVLARSTGAGPGTSGPLDAGWPGALVRVPLYAALLVFAAALAVPWLLDSPAGRISAATRHPGASAPAVAALAHRARCVATDAGLLAAALGAVAAMLSGLAVAGAGSAHALADALLARAGGGAEVAVVVITGLAVAVARLAPPIAVTLAFVALGALELSGHGTPTPWPAVGFGSIELVASAIWLGGSVLVGIVLWRSSPAARSALAPSLLTRFAPIAVPAAVIAVATGAVHAALVVGRPERLLTHPDGRIVALKVALMALAAMMSGLYARRLRGAERALDVPAAAGLRSALDRSAPALAVAIAATIATVGVLPGGRPPAASAPRAPGPGGSCRPCPVPSPRPDELAVAGRAGSYLVAAWVRWRAGRLVGTVRVLDIQGRLAAPKLALARARLARCGPGCRRFSITGAPTSLRLSVSQRGRRYRIILPARWQRGQTARAGRLLPIAQETMRRLRTVREREIVTTVPSLSSITYYRLAAPDRLGSVSSVLTRRRGGRDTLRPQGDSVIVAGHEWIRQAREGIWQRGEYGGGLPFRTRRWFRWTPYARVARLLWWRGRRAEIALMDPGTPAWWRLRIDLATNRVRAARLATNGYFMTQRFFAFNRPVRIAQPSPTGH